MVFVLCVAFAARAHSRSANIEYDGVVHSVLRIYQQPTLVDSQSICYKTLALNYLLHHDKLAVDSYISWRDDDIISLMHIDIKMTKM